MANMIASTFKQLSNVWMAGTLADHKTGKTTSLHKNILLKGIYQVIVLAGLKHKPQQLGKQNTTRV